jgi:hypothetical protein
MKLDAAILRTFGVAGAALFAFFFVLTFWRPAWVETFAADFLKAQVASELHERIDSFGTAGSSEVLSKAAEIIYRRNQQRIDEYKARLEAHVDERIAECISQMLDLQSEARARVARLLEAGTLQGASSLTALNERMTDVIQGRYLRTVNELKRDLRIFTATNACCFLLLLLATFVRPQFMKQLFVPGYLLLAATIYCSYSYVYEQNWLLTVIYSDYLGFAYLGYLSVVFLLLCDFVLNRARVTLAIMNGMVGTIAAMPR